ncbi:type II and III secretion system protein family protein [Candidatus Nitronereus thalassa]|uniref:Type II and III secretion system protein family protein n=1 Tax=Candidatus Nitronereus thalassa TaxID=3020898 RepID=A0ABU3K3P0_9BACT|nr:type II and III secretion system protein family protein [Candidatus Nitronereus thalassa]MDT7041002.1 type II and III secretion system protein family protein [Candidatus Nitronereus thalassa]
MSNKFSVFNSSLIQPISCRISKLAVVFVVTLSLIFGTPIQALSDGLTRDIIQTPNPQTLSVVVGKSTVLQSPLPLKRASLANPEIADTLVLSPTQLYLNGKTIGSTNLTLWGRDGNVFAVYDVVVQPNITRLKTQIHELFPEENSIEVRASQAHITLSGSASGPEVITQVVGLANTYAPEKVMNFMQVQGVQQVMLEVKVAEMAKGVLKRLGVNILNVSNRTETIGLLDDLTSFSRDDQTGALTQLLGTSVDLAVGFDLGSDVLLVALAALKQHNLTKILAEPTLVSLSGQEASFLAGGEFPVPVPQSFGVTTIKFKEFGVSLKFNPTVLGDGNITLKIAPEVSELDFSNGVNFEGFTIPALLTRKVETIIELKDGQSFAIAGLLQDNIREAIAKYPVLGDIPILGALFRSTSFRKNETELIIIVTPRLVKPLDMKKQSLPTDAYLEPNDFELMLMGYMEGVRRNPGQNSGGVSQEISKTKQSNRKTLSVSSPTEPPSALVPMAGGFEGQFGHLAP